MIVLQEQSVGFVCDSNCFLFYFSAKQRICEVGLWSKFWDILIGVFC